MCFRLLKVLLLNKGGVPTKQLLGQVVKMEQYHIITSVKAPFSLRIFTDERSLSIMEVNKNNVSMLCKQ